MKRCIILFASILISICSIFATAAHAATVDKYSSCVEGKTYLLYVGNAFTGSAAGVVTFTHIDNKTGIGGWGYVSFSPWHNVSGVGTYKVGLNQNNIDGVGTNFVNAVGGFGAICQGNGIIGAGFGTWGDLFAFVGVTHGSNANPTPTPTRTRTPRPTSTRTPAVPTATPTRTRTPRSTPTPTPAPAQCSDGYDNDHDGLIDLNDPGCSSSQDNNEGDDVSVNLLTPFTDCVSDNGDGTYTAYFGYENKSNSTVYIPVGNANGAINMFSPSPINRGQPEHFDSGMVRGAFSVVFDGNPLTWTLKDVGCASTKATASADISPRCQAITPKLECVDEVQYGEYSATFGYENPNGFDIIVPLGNKNFFTPDPSDRGQPTIFKSGKVSTAFQAPFMDGETIKWKLTGRNANASSASPSCSNNGGCSKVQNASAKTALDQSAQILSDVSKNADMNLAGVSSAQAGKRSSSFLSQAKSLTKTLPKEMTCCPVTPKNCTKVDNQATIDELGKLYLDQYTGIKRVAGRSKDKSASAYVKQAGVAYDDSTAALKQIPRYYVECR